MKRTPPWWASKGAALAARGLPAGPIRERYEQEFVAELYAMTRWQAARHVVELIASAQRLRTALACDIDQPAPVPARPVACRLNLRHDWHLFHTEDGGRYKACLRCHKEHPEWRYYLWRYPGDNIRGSFGA